VQEIKKLGNGFVEFNCYWCGEKSLKATGHANISLALGGKIHCSRKCGGLSRRTTDADKKEKKRLYDLQYRKDNFEKIRKRHQDYFKKDYAANPEKYRAIRKAKAQEHLEYCRTPEYRAWKREYDQKHVAKRDHGEFWESALLIKQIENQYNNTAVKQEKGLLNKSAKRQDQYDKNTKDKYKLRSKSILTKPKML